MKITKTFVSVFFVTFLIGYVSVLPTKRTPASDIAEKADLQAQNYHDFSKKLILETENVKQLLYSVGKMGDARWNLVWVGDLDGDGKLDLYADLTDFYNFSERRLFLSSQAEKGKLVRQIANFWTNGC